MGLVRVYIQQNNEAYRFELHRQVNRLRLKVGAAVNAAEAGQGLVGLASFGIVAERADEISDFLFTQMSGRAFSKPGGREDAASKQFELGWFSHLNIFLDDVKPGSRTIGPLHC